jgi:hypothetical protein
MRPAAAYTSRSTIRRTGRLLAASIPVMSSARPAATADQPRRISAPRFDVYRISRPRHTPLLPSPYRARYMTLE